VQLVIGFMMNNRADAESSMQRFVHRTPFAYGSETSKILAYLAAPAAQKKRRQSEVNLILCEYFKGEVISVRGYV